MVGATKYDIVLRQISLAIDQSLIVNACNQIWGDDRWCFHQSQTGSGIYLWIVACALNHQFAWPGLNSYRPVRLIWNIAKQRKKQLPWLLLRVQDPLLTIW